MKDKKYLIILFSVLFLCIAFTALHFAYAVYAYNHCSIIYFIGKEWW